MNEIDTLPTEREMKSYAQPFNVTVTQLCILYTCMAHTEQRIFVFSSIYFPEDFVGTAAASEPWKLLLR
jgi:hypothetical protein